MLVALGLVLVAVIQVTCLLALVDQYRSLLQIRESLALVDTPQELPLLDLEGVRPSSIGLPATLDTEDVAVVVLLSTKCTTCTAVARGFGQFPAPGWAVITAGSEEQCRAFQDAVGLHGERVLRDVDGRIIARANLRTFPSAIVFARGAAVNLRTIPSHRQLRRMLEDRAHPNAAVN